MGDKFELQSFLKELMDNIEKASYKTSAYQEFMKEFLLYVDSPNTPSYIDLYRPVLNVQLDAYVYDEEGDVLDLYVLHYDEGISREELTEITMTELREIANKVKRFYTSFNNIPLDPSHPSMELVKLLKDNNNTIEKVNIIILTNYYYRSNKTIDIKNLKGPDINVQVWDIDRVYQVVTMNQETANIKIDFEEEFDQAFELMFVPNPEKEDVKDNFDCYIGFIPAVLLARVYDKWGPKLVERNVRSFLQARGGTNKGIRDTLRDPVERQMFVAYNNGISSVARTGGIEQVAEGINLYRINTLEGWQIVNGGQTTASIHQAYKSDIDLRDVYIQTKLTILQLEETEHADLRMAEDEMVSKISKYANTQNKINQSDLVANTRFMSSLEHHSRTVWIPSQDGRKADTKWYFERARGQYMVDIGQRKRGKEQNDFKKEYPKKLLLNKVDLAKNFMSWEGFPHVSSKGGEEAFKKFMDQNKSFWKHEKDEKDKTIVLEELTSFMYQELIAKVIVNRKVEEIVDLLGLKGYKANVIYYSTAMLNLLYGNEIDLQSVWKKQSLSDKWDNVIREIAQKTLEFLRDSAGEQNVTQWAKKEQCWIQYREECQKQLKNLV